MRHARGIFALILVADLVATSIYCSGVRMAGMSQGLSQSCCTACHQSPTPPVGCDRCDMGPLGLLATVHPALHIPPPQLLAVLPAWQPTDLSPFSYAATIALASHPPPPTSLVALHCQLTT
jgi:hypothetical protein